MQASQSNNDQTAHISLQISINVKKQQEQNHGTSATLTTPRPVSHSQNFPGDPDHPARLPVPPAFPPSVKRYLRRQHRESKTKNAAAGHLSRITMLSQGNLFAETARHGTVGPAEPDPEANLALITPRIHPVFAVRQRGIALDLIFSGSLAVRRNGPMTAVRRFRNEKGATLAGPRLLDLYCAGISASRTGSCGAPWPCRISSARRHASRASGSQRPSAPRAAPARAVAGPG